MAKTTLEDLNIKLKEKDLTNDESKYFLSLSNLKSILLRVEGFYNKAYGRHINIKNIHGMAEIKKYLKIEDKIEDKKEHFGIKIFNPFPDSVLIEACLRENIVNKILTLDEKDKIKKMYSADINRKAVKLTKDIKNIDELATGQKNKLIDESSRIKQEQTVRELSDFVLKIKDFLDISKQNLKSKRDLIEEITGYLTSKNINFILDNLPTEELLSIKKDLFELNLKIKIVIEIIERIKTIEYHRKLRDFKEKEEKELLEKIEARKNGLLVDEKINKKPSKNEPIIIEAYLDDFNSSRSRFVMAVMTANNINLSFHHGLIKLINEDKTFEEIYFSSSGDILTFSCEKYLKDISINTLSNEKLNDILLKQTANKYFIDNILNCLSIIHYINTFYNEKEKVEVFFEDIESIKINDKSSAENQKNKGIIYLSKSLNRNRIRTIKIKKGKRQIEGTFLIRGHWRRQKYLEGVKLIWIEPFWKGAGKEKKRVYKILKQQ